MSAITVDISDLAERIMGVPEAAIIADLKQAQARTQSLIAEADSALVSTRAARLARAAKPRPGKRVMR